MPDYIEFKKRLSAAFPNADLRFGELMSGHTSFRIGGPAAAMLLPRSTEETELALELARELGLRTVVMGNGTDLLVADEGLDALVVKLCDGLGQARRAGARTIEAEAGITLSRLARFALDEGLAGLEFASGIPGTLGGAVYMNAGAYGSEMKDAVTAVTALTAEGLRVFRGEENRFSYRSSRFAEGGVVLRAELTLTPGDPEEIQVKMDELNARRRASQPLNLPSAGSAFKRPKQGYAAALIQAAGLKGYAVGGAQVSEKHAGFIVNRGGATCGDVLRLMEHIQKRVLETSGVTLEPEIRVLK